MQGVAPSLLLIAVASGAMIPIQAGANAVLSKSLGHPLWASMISLAVSVAALAVVLALWRPTIPNFANAMSNPWWVWIGGVVGVIYITAALILAPKLGAATFLAAVVAGQMIAALILDQYGLVGFSIRPANMWRIGGIVLIVAGVVMMQKATPASPTSSEPTSVNSR